MPPVYQGKYHTHFHHQLKRLNHPPTRHTEQKKITNLPGYMFDDNIPNKTPKYIKFFDYSLPELLTDHSTNPLQNTTRQYISPSSNFPKEGRFTNHEMIMRRNGETTILRPRQDLVLVNGFTPVIRPSSIFSSHRSPMSHSRVPSSLSIINKMSTKKREQTSIIKAKRKDRYQVKYCNEKFDERKNVQHSNFTNQFQYNNLQDPTFIHLVKQALHTMIEEKKHLPIQPLPLMSVLPEFHSPPSSTHISQPFIPRPEEPYLQGFFHHSPYFQEPNHMPSDNRYTESFYDLPPEQYRSFEQKSPSYLPFPKQEHFCGSHERNYTHMSGYFF